MAATPYPLSWEDIAMADRQCQEADNRPHWQSRFSSTVERPAVDGEMHVQLVQPGPLV